MGQHMAEEATALERSADEEKRIKLEEKRRTTSPSVGCPEPQCGAHSLSNRRLRSEGEAEENKEERGTCKERKGERVRRGKG